MLKLLFQLIPLNLRAVGRSLSWLGLVSVVAKPIWFVFITVVCVRVLGAASYGEMATALSLAALAFSFTGFGVGEYTVREVSRDRSQASLFLTNFLGIRLVFVGLAWLVAALTGILLKYDGPLWYALLCASAYQMMLGVTMYMRYYFRIFEQLKYEALSIALEKGLVIGLGIALLYGTRTSYGTLAGMAAGMATTCLITLKWTTWRFAPLQWNLLSWTFLRRSLRLMVPFGLAALFQLFYFRTDQVMIEAFMDTKAAGHYGLAYRIIEALNMIPLLLAQAAVFPRVSRLFEQNKMNEFVRLIRSSFAGLAVVSLVVALALTYVAPMLIEVITGDAAFAEAGPALRLLAWTFPFASLRIILYVALVAMGQERFVAGATGIVMTFNIATNFLLIPAAGIMGASLTTVASEPLLALAFAVRYRRSSPSKRILPIPDDS